MEIESNKKIYELGYHVLPNLSEDEVAKVVTGIKDTLAKMEATVISEQFPQMMTLAYELGKEIENKTRRFTTAYFGWIKFEVETAQIENFKTEMDKNLNILRFIIIKTVRESTLATPKLTYQRPAKRTSTDAVVGTPMDEVAVDKKIDEMLEEDAVVAPAEDALPEVL